MNKKITKSKKQVFTKRLVSIRSRHPSIDALRGTVYADVKAVYRHGSISPHKSSYEINSITSVKNSASKLEMKKLFDKGEVKHLPWILLCKAEVNEKEVTDGKTQLKFPVVIKHFFGSRGEGNYKVDNIEQFKETIKGKTLTKYLVEQYYSGSVEFRIHITNYGPIYSLRKLLKNDIPKEKRWVRNDDTCVWITEFKQNRDNKNNFINFTNEANEKFNKPQNWREIISECKKALTAIGADVLAVDVKAQSSKDNKNPVKFYILEVNSAPSMGEITLEIYKEHLPKIIKSKYAQ